MRNALVGVVLSALSSIAIPAVAQADCACPGRLEDHFPLGQTLGGDSNPLQWVFEDYLERLVTIENETKPLYCFHKDVINRSAADVYLVRWRIADYGQDLIPHGEGLPSCNEYLGGLAPAPLNGPLNFDVAARSYDTTVRTPTGGWAAQLAAPSSSASINSTKWPELSSQFTFSNVNNEGKLTTGVVAVASGITFVEGSKKVLSYAVKNEGAEPASVLINLSMSKEGLEQMPLAEHFVLIPGKEGRAFDVTLTAGDIRTEPATIVIESAVGRPTMINSVGVYAVSGGIKARSDADLWNGQ